MKTIKIDNEYVFCNVCELVFSSKLLSLPVKGVADFGYGVETVLSVFTFVFNFPDICPFCGNIETRLVKCVNAK